MKNVENNDGKSIFENGYQIRGIILSRDEMMYVSKAYHIGLLQEYIQENYPGYQMDEYFRLARDVFAMQEKGMEEKEAIQYVLKQFSTQEPFYSETNMDYLRKADQQVQNGQVVVKTMAELEAMELE